MPTIPHDYQTELAEIEDNMKQNKDKKRVIDVSIATLLTEIKELATSRNHIEIKLLQFIFTLPDGILSNSHNLTLEKTVFLNELTKLLDTQLSAIERKQEEIIKLRTALHENVANQKTLLQLRMALKIKVSENLQSKIDRVQSELDEPNATPNQNDPLLNDIPALLVRHRKISQREMNSIALPLEWYPANPRRAAKPV